MRFLILTQYFEPEVGAAQVRLGAVARALLRKGHDVEVVTSMPNYPTGSIFPGYRRRFYVEQMIDGIRVHRVWSYPGMGTGVKRMAGYASFAATALVGLLRAHRADCLFVESPPLFAIVPAYIVAKLRRMPIVFNVADMWPDAIRDLGVMKDGPALRLAGRLEAFAYRVSAAVNAVTEGIRIRLVTQKHVPPAKVLFFPNGVDVVTFAPAAPDPRLAEQIGVTGKRIVLYAGTHGMAHGLDVALDAASLITDPSVLFLFVGDGSEKARLMASARSRRLRNVLFLSARPPADIARLYALSDVALSTLRDFPMYELTRPAKVFAAMACGKPVIYSGGGEGARLIQAAGAGVVTPAGDGSALAEAVMFLLADDARRSVLGRSAREWVARELSWESVMDKWLADLRTPMSYV